MRIVSHWQWSPEVVVVPPSLEIFKIQMQSPVKLAVSDLDWSG